MPIFCNNKKVLSFIPQRIEYIFPILEKVAEVNGIELINPNKHNGHDCNAMLIIRGDEDNSYFSSIVQKVPSLTIRIVQSTKSNARLKFSNSTHLSSLLRNRTLSLFTEAPVTNELITGEVLASLNGIPVWTLKDNHVYNLQPYPWLLNDARLFEHLKGPTLLRLIPLIEWFRSISDWSLWKKPKPNAVFVFDDPNLHWSSYGCLSFKELGELGKKYSFHTALATIPIDQYYINHKAVNIFKKYKSELSLLVHGNDHTHHELRDHNNFYHCLSIVSQAMTRISKFENKSSINVDRVMVPPHGRIGKNIIRACSMLGFDGVCTSLGSVWSSNKKETSTKYLGLEPCSVLFNMPIIPRFHLKTEMIEAYILLAAYLGQPIVPSGHHWDVIDGLDHLVRVAQIINKLSDIKWLRLDEVLKVNYWWKDDDNQTKVIPFTRRFRINTSLCSRKVIIEIPWLKNNTNCNDIIIKPLNSQCSIDIERSDSNTWQVFFSQKNEVIEFAIRPSINTLPARIKHNLSLKAYFRRFIVEARDRLITCRVFP